MSAMSLDLRPSGRIAGGGTVLKIAGKDDWLWLASPAGIFHFDGSEWRAVMRGVPFWWVNTVLTAGDSVWAAGLPAGLVRSVEGDQVWSRCWAEQVEAPVISLAASPNFQRDRVLLAGTDGDGILRSDDGGRHWQLSNFGLRSYAIFDLAAAPVWGRYEYAFAVSEGGLYQSPNGGRAWRRADLDDAVWQPSVAAVSPDFATDQKVFAGCEGGELLVSTDAGRSYHLAAAGFEAITALAFTPQGSLLVGTAGGIFRIEGKELRPNTDLKGNGLSRGVGGWVGKDGIQSLEEATPDFSGSLPAEGLSTASEQVSSSVLSLNAVGSSLYAGLADGLHRSADDGRSWQFMSGLSARRFVWFFIPASDLWLVGGPEEGVWCSNRCTGTPDSTEAGCWRPVWTDTPVLALAANGNRIWLSSETGVATSVDKGASWQSVLTSGTPITALAVTKRAVWAGSHDSRLWRGALDASSGNDSPGTGGNWQAVTPPFAGSQMLGLFAREEVLLAAVWAMASGSAAGSGTITLWRSEDDGQSWSNWFSRPSRPVAPQLAFVDGDGNEALIGLGVDLYRSTASGWQRQRVTTPDAPITGLLPLAGQTLMSLTDRLVVSAGGSEWESVESGVDGHSLAALGQSGEEVVVVTGDGQIWQGRHESH